MVPRALRLIHALTGAAAIALLLVGCAGNLGSIVREEGIDSDALVRLSDTFAVAAKRTPSGVQVVAFQQDDGGRWASRVIASDAGGASGDTTAHLVTLAGETGDEWNSFFYGTAPDPATRIAVAGFHATGGHVTDGAWVIALRQKDVLPGHLRWNVTDATGAIVDSGSGITP